jgi:hypothetical protein
VCSLTAAAALWLCWLQSYAVDAILSGADLTNAVVDRVDFSNAKLNGAKFINAVVTGVCKVPGTCRASWLHVENEQALTFNAI